jgi:hypothetical protein
VNVDQVLLGFWKAFDEPPYPLNETPEYVNTITLFTSGPNPDSTYNTSALFRYEPQERVLGWVRELQERGVRLLVSIYDNPSAHWSEVDIPKFVGHVVEEAIQGWGLDGVDIDLESDSATGEDFTRLIREFRSQLGPAGTDGPERGRIVVADGYQFYEGSAERQALESAGGDLDWLNTLSYWNAYDYMIYTFNAYAAILTPAKVAIGVKPGFNQRDQSTPSLDEAARLAAFEPAGGRKAGMMVYTLNRDQPDITRLPRWSWCTDIADKLRASPAGCDVASHDTRVLEEGPR